MAAGCRAGGGAWRRGGSGEWLQGAEQEAGPGAGVPRHWVGLDLLEAAEPCDDPSPDPCRTVAPEKRHEYELAEGTGREIWRKRQIQGQVVERTLEGSSWRVLPIKKGGPRSEPCSCVLLLFAPCQDGDPCVGLEEQLRRMDALCS